MMTLEEISKKMDELKGYKELMDELKKAVESIEDEIKAYMVENNVDEIVSVDSKYKATYRLVLSKRFDSTEFKKDFGDIYNEYCKPTQCKRFTFK